MFNNVCTTGFYDSVAYVFYSDYEEAEYTTVYDADIIYLL